MSLTSIFQDIADAIRTKTGKSESIYPVDMASEIEGIESGGGYKLEKMPSGAVSSFNDGTDLPLNKLKVSIEPVQDLHGYDAPWAGGAGKNLADKATETPSDITVTVEEDGKLTLNGTTTAVVYIRGALSCPNSTKSYTWALFNNASYERGVEFSVRNRNNDPAGGWAKVDAVNKTYTFTPDAGKTPTKWQIQISSGVTFNNFVISPMIVSGSIAPTSYEPYSNICPITGWDAVNVTVADVATNPTVSHTYTIDLNGTRYGGTLDVVSGVLTVTNANIVSYNGEIINEPWISSMDVYSAGATPTTGAQVVYPLATPQTIQLTPTAVRSLIELNNIWADTGDIINGEYFKGAGTRPTS